MATVIDPICGMRIEADDAAAIAEYEGQTHYFCSEACRDGFVSEPSAHGAPGPAGTDAAERGAGRGPHLLTSWRSGRGHPPADRAARGERRGDRLLPSRRRTRCQRSGAHTRDRREESRPTSTTPYLRTSRRRPRPVLCPGLLPRSLPLRASSQARLTRSSRALRSADVRSEWPRRDDASRQSLLVRCWGWRGP